MYRAYLGSSMRGVRPIRLAIISHDFQCESCKPEIYLFHVGGAQIIYKGIILISKGFNLCVSVFNQGSIDVYRPRGTLSSLFWNSISFSLLDFVHCGRLLETSTFIEFIPKVPDMSTLSNAGNS